MSRAPPRIGVVAGLLLASTQRAEEPGRFIIGADYRWGRAEGFMQVARGGEPGSSSHHRPTLDDIGLDEVAMPTAFLGYEWGRHHVFLSGQFLELEGSNVLDEDLIPRRKIRHCPHGRC